MRSCSGSTTELDDLEGVHLHVLCLSFSICKMGLIVSPAKVVGVLNVHSCHVKPLNQSLAHTNIPFSLLWEFSKLAAFIMCCFLPGIPPPPWSDRPEPSCDSQSQYHGLSETNVCSQGIVRSLSCGITMCGIISWFYYSLFYSSLNLLSCRFLLFEIQIRK